MASTVKIIHVESGDIIFECALDDIAQAYKRVTEYEEMGLEVKLVVPSTPETLIDHLKVNEEDKETYRKSLAEEIDSHDDDSCCYKPPGFEKPKIQ